MSVWCRPTSQAASEAYPEKQRVDAVSDCLAPQEQASTQILDVRVIVHRVRDELRADISTREVVVEAAVAHPRPTVAPVHLSGAGWPGICPPVVVRHGRNHLTAGKRHVVKVRKDENQMAESIPTQGGGKSAALRFSARARVQGNISTARTRRPRGATYWHSMWDVWRRIECLSCHAATQRPHWRQASLVDAHGLVVISRS